LGRGGRRRPSASSQKVEAEVLIAVTRLNIGGPASQVLALAKGASSRWKTVVAAGKPPHEEGELSDPAVPVLLVPLVRPLSPPSDVRAFRALRRLIAASGARLVHTHMAKAGALGRLAAMSVGRQARRPRLVHTFHGHVLQGYFGAAQQRGFLELERALARRTDVLVAVSPEVRDELLGLGVGRPEQYRVVPLGLDLSRFAAVGTPAVPNGRLRATLGLGADVPLAGTVGRLVPIKDHATLLRALSMVPGLHLALLGDGELRGQLVQLASDLGLADRAHFAGWWQDMPSALADLDAVVVSSRNEGTPAALIEALAAARPVVATDVGGVRHVVQGGETGWLCPCGDPSALAAALGEAVFSQRQKAALMATEGRRRALARFGLGRMLEDYFSIYSELLASSTN
jgi:glycosyltransferase involved in cell wall biosynthesis